MAPQIENRTLQTTQSDHLTISFYRQNEKVKLDTVSLKVGETLSSFPLSEILMNGLPAKNLKKFSAQILEEKSSICAEVVEGKLSLRSLSSNLFTISLKHESGTLTLNVTPDLKVSGLRKLIEKELDYSDFQIYSSRTETLHKSDTLEDCQITEGKVLMIISDKDPDLQIDEENSQAKSPFEFGVASLAFVNCKHIVTQPFDKRAPDWRSVGPGLNLVGECATPSCEAYKELAIEPKGFGTWQMHEACRTTSCPVGDHLLINVKNAYFHHCVFTVDGLTTNDEHFDIPKTSATSNAYATTFATTKDGKSVIEQWKSLTITVSEVPFTFCSLV